MISALGAAAIVLMAGFAARPRPPARLPTTSISPHGAPSFRFAAIRGRTKRPGAVVPGEVAAWCDALARAVRGGSTLGAALRDADPPASCVHDIEPVMLALERGRSLTTALDSGSSSPHLTLALSVMHACAINGGPPAEPLDRTAATLRARAIALAERQTQSAQARLSVVVMTVLPIALLTLLLVTSSATRAATVTPVGLAALAGGGALNVIGWHWMRRIVAGRPS